MAASAALVIGMLALGAASLGPLDRQRDQISACRAQGQLDLLKSGQRWTEDGSSAPGNIYVKACMTEHGYDFNFAGKFCQPTFSGDEVTNPHCYRSHSFALLTDIDIAAHDGFNDWPSELWCRRLAAFTSDYCRSHGWFR